MTKAEREAVLADLNTRREAEIAKMRGREARGEHPYEEGVAMDKLKREAVCNNISPSHLNLTVDEDGHAPTPRFHKE